MKKRIKKLHFALSMALIIILTLTFFACDSKEDKQETPDELPCTEEGCKEENENNNTSNKKYTYTISELYSSRDELKIYGKLYVRNEIEGKVPAVILSHSANLNADSMNLYAIGFAERGFIAYAFDFCGSSKKSRSDGSIDDMTLFSEIADLKAVLSTISLIDNVDKNRIYLFGTSQGGLVTALTAEECKDAIAGEILLYPAFNIPELVNKASGLGSLSGIFGGGYSKAFSDTLKDYDVYAHIGNFNKKVLILHGSSDFIVKKSYSERAAQKYADCVLKIIEHAGHGFNKENYSLGGSYDDIVWESVDEYFK